MVNDRLGALPVVLIADPATRSVRAYERGARTFRADADRLVADAWQSFRPDGEVADPAPQRP